MGIVASLLRIDPFRRNLLLVAVGGWAVRIAYLVLAEPTVLEVSDGRAYHLLGVHLSEGEGYVRPFDLLAGESRPSAEYPPLFPLLLAAVSLVGVDTIAAHQVVQTALGAGGVVLVGLLGRRVGGEAVGIVAAGLAAVHPMFVQSDAITMAETTYTLAVVGLLLALSHALDRPSNPTLAAVGGLGAVATLARSEAALLSVLVVVGLALAGRRPDAVRRMALAGGAFVIVLAPWLVRNLAVFGEPVLTNNLGSALDGANCDLAYDGDQVGLWFFNPTCFEGFQQDALAVADEAEVAADHRTQGLDYIRSHTRDLPRVATIRVLRTWGVWDVGRLNDLAATGEGRNLAWETIGTRIHWFALPTAVAGLALMRRRKARIWPLLLPAVVVTFTAATTYGNQRFRVAFEPVLVVAVAYAVVAGAHAWRRGDLAGLVRRVVDAGQALIPGPARSWIAAGVLIGLFVLPLRGLLRSQGPPMEEGFMLVFPERVLAGDVPNRDFLHLYGPGGVWGLAAAFKAFGASLATERLFGLAQQVLLVFAVFSIARRWGRVAAVLAGSICLVLIVPPIGLTALAWVGALGLALAGLSAGLTARDREDSGASTTTRWWFGCGLLLGLAVLFRLDLVLAGGLGLAAVAWRPTLARAKPIAAGLVAGGAPYVFHLATAGPVAAIRGMVLDPVVYLRGGRRLPVPPPFDRVDGFLQRAGDLHPLPWPAPTPSTAAQISLWFFMLIGSVALLLVAGRRWRRRADPGPGRVLWAVALFSLGLMPQAVQRADSTHLAWVACVPFAFVPIVVADWVRRRRTRWEPAAAHVIAGVGVLLLLVATIPNFTARRYLDFTAQTFGRHRLAFAINHEGRNFYHGRADVAAVLPAVLAEVDARTEPGDRLFVGPTDLRFTPYSDAFIYFLLPDLVPATYYIEMDPGMANREGSGLDEDLASADVAVLSGVWVDWDEPNESRHVGSSAPVEVLARDFCLVERYADGLYEVWERCP